MMGWCVWPHGTAKEIKSITKIAIGIYIPHQSQTPVA